MATLTCTQAISGVQPRGNHNGVDAITSVLRMPDQAISLSDGDVINICRIPNGTTLLAIQMTQSITGLDVHMGLSLDGLVLVASLTAGAGISVLGGGFLPSNPLLPVAVSLSDDALGIDGFNAMLRAEVLTVTSGSAIGVVSFTMWLTRNPGTGQPTTG